MMRLADNPVQRYSWGSPEAIPRLLGVEPDGLPQAELWLGAHERAASRVLGPGGPECLLDLVRRDPRGSLGEPWARERRMPFLAKVIATAEPLSLQVHPDARRAARWFAAEEARGIGRDRPERSCPDEVAKVEMVWALSPFRALCGFRPPGETADWLHELAAEPLAPTEAALRRDGRAALRPEAERLLRLPDPATAVAAVRAGAQRLRTHPRWAASAGAAVELAERYPSDPAVAFALLLRPLVLAPGEAMFVRTGQPHTYLSGTAFELQANSDNVLRAGLTGKHVDVGLLLEALDTRAEGVAAIAPATDGDEEVFAPQTARFALGVVRRSDGHRPLRTLPGPQVLFCVDGDFRLDDGTATMPLARGGSAFVPASSAPLRVRGEGTLLRVTTGRAPVRADAHEADGDGLDLVQDGTP